MMKMVRFAEFMPWDGAISGANFKLNGAPSNVDVQLECECIYTHLWLSVAFYEVRGKPEKNASGAGQRTKMFCRIL